MQALVDIVNGGTGSIQRIFAFFIIGGLILAGILTLGATTAAPVVADQIGARAESLGEKAIDAAFRPPITGLIEQLSDDEA